MAALHPPILIQEGGVLHQHGFQTSPGDSKVQPGLRTPALVDCVRCPAAPCLDAEQVGPTERWWAPRERPDALGTLPCVNCSAAIESEGSQPRANEGQAGRRASRQLRLSPPFPGPGALCRTFWGRGGSAGSTEEASASSQLPLKQGTHCSHRKTQHTKGKQVSMKVQIAGVVPLVWVTGRPQRCLPSQRH